MLNGTTNKPIKITKSSTTISTSGYTVFGNPFDINKDDSIDHSCIRWHLERKCAGEQARKEHPFLIIFYQIYLDLYMVGKVLINDAVLIYFVKFPLSLIPSTAT